ASCVTSAGTKIACGPRSSAICWPFDPGRSTKTTLLPSANKRLTHARPKPDAPPVTSAVAPFASMMLSFSIPELQKVLHTHWYFSMRRFHDDSSIQRLHELSSDNKLITGNIRVYTYKSRFIVMIFKEKIYVNQMHTI